MADPLDSCLVAEAKRRSDNASRTKLKWTDLSDSQLNYLYNKFYKYAVPKDWGVDENPDYCLVLPDLTAEKQAFKKRNEIQRPEREAKKRRGAYYKGQYSHTGGYVQVTFSKKENKDLEGDFPRTRTFQATHLVLRQAGLEPPTKNRFCYTASHRCGNSGCVRLEHLLWERMDVNYSRRLCHSLGISECEHDPPCLYRAFDILSDAN